MEQQAFLESFTQTLLESDEKTAVVAFAVPRRDEFWVCERARASYGWAQKNTRPTFKTDEKKGIGPMDS